MSKRKKGTLAELVPPTEKNESKKQPKKVRRFCITTYIDREQLERFIRRSPWIQHFAICTHDRDIESNGKPKGIHTHLILYTYNPHTSSGIKKKFDRYSAEYYGNLNLTPQNTLVQECHSVVSQFRYLRHLDDPDKSPYEESEVVTDDYMYWKELCRTNGMNDSSVNTGLQIFDDMLDGVSTREMIVRYGKEFIYHSHSFRECIVEHYKEQPRGVDENLLNFIEYRQVASDILSSQTVIKQEQIQAFFNVLDYLHEQCLLDINLETKGVWNK